MTETFIQLTEDEFDDRYPLIPNHINPSAGWVIGDAGGCLFETYGEEFAFVRRYDPHKVWTLVDGDDGDMYVISGLHLVNRVGYLLSRDPVPDHATIQVHLPMENAEDDPLIQEPSTVNRDTRLAEIASRHLGISTLETRNSDSLDFHTVAVWSVVSALNAAFEAGDSIGSGRQTRLEEALQMVRATLKLRQLDEASDIDIEEAIRIADVALTGNDPKVTT